MRQVFSSLSRLAGLVLLLLAAGCFGPSPSEALLDKLIREKQLGVVFDYANVIQGSDRAVILNTLNELERLTSAQVKVVTLVSLEGGEIRDFANRLFAGWGIGQKGKDNGVLLLMAKEERKIWIEVGYGLEGALPDGRVGRLLDDSVIPDFKQGRYSSGLRNGALAVAQIVAAEYKVSLSGTPGASTAPPAEEESLFSIILQALLLLAFIIFAIRHPFLAMMLLSGGRGGGGRSGGFGGGGGGFGGGLSGGGGAGRSW